MTPRGLLAKGWTPMRSLGKILGCGCPGRAVGSGKHAD
jgi:hypothetical protein